MEGISLLFKVFWSPGEALLRAAKNNKAAIVPIVVITLVGIVCTMIMFSHVSTAEIAMRAIEQSGRAQEMSPEQKERVMAIYNGPVMRALPMIAATVGPTVTIAIVTLIYFGLFSLVGRQAGFAAFFAITAFAFVPLIIRNIAAAITVVVVPKSSLMVDELGSISPSIFLDRGTVSKALFAFVSQIDVVSIWILLLLIIGFGFLVRRGLSPATRAVCVFAPWVVWIVVRVGFAALLPS